MRRGLSPGVAILTTIACAVVVAAPPEAPSSPDPATALRENLRQRGVETCDNGEWAEALPLHERLTTLDPDHGFGWMGLGWSRQYTGDPKGAIGAYEKVLTLGGMPLGRVHVQIAECRLALGDRAGAIASVRDALAAGYVPLGGLMKNNALRALRDEPEFRALAGEVAHPGMTREQGWAADLDLLAREVKRAHVRPWRVLLEGEFDAEIASIKRDIASVGDEAAAVRVMALVKRLGDGHSVVETAWQLDATERAVPLLFGQFDEGLYVTAADVAHADLVWSRVDAIAGEAAPALLRRLDALVSCDNAMRLLSQGPMLMRHPAILKGLGLATDGDSLELRLTGRDGAGRRVSVKVAKREGAWVRTPPGVDAPLPRHVARRSELYWSERLPGTRVRYVQYNGCGEMENLSLGAFADATLSEFDASDEDTLIFDIRWNGGGNQFVTRPLLSRLLRSPKAMTPGAFYVIAGRHTFSAAMIFAAQLERYTPAIFVGEATGSSPNFVGETNIVRLPYTGMEASVSNLAWQNSHATDNRAWIAPSIRVPTRIGPFTEGRDEAVEAILRWRAELGAAPR